MSPYRGLGQIQTLFQRAVTEYIWKFNYPGDVKNLPTGRLKMLFRVLQASLTTFSHVCPQKLDPKQDFLKNQILKLQLPSCF